MKPVQFLFEHTVLTASPRTDGWERLKDRLDSRAHPQIEVALPSGEPALVNLDGVIAVGLPEAMSGSDPSRWGHRYQQIMRVSAGPYLFEGTAHLWLGLGMEAWLHEEVRFVALTSASAQRDGRRVVYGTAFVARQFVNWLSWDGGEQLVTSA
jgi:hypothetical protein